MTNRPIKGAAFGAVATALIQSSSLLMVTMIGMINANLMTLEQAIGVMMGQEIGTTLTAQIIAFKVGDFSFLFIALGLGMMEFTSKRSWQRLGEVILGFGVIFVGMQTMSGALKVLATAPAAQEWLAYMGQNYLSGIIAGTIATAVIQSSSAVTGLIVAMGISQIITLPGAIALILGANIGTCITGVIASLRLSPASKRAAIAQILHNGIGVLLFLPFLSPFADLVSETSSSLPRQIANAHGIHNIVVSAVLFPFIKTIARVSERLVPKTQEESAVLFPFIKTIARVSERLVPKTQEEEKPKLTQHIDESQYRFPNVALAEATHELYRAGKTTAEMIVLSRQAILEGDSDAAQQVRELESQTVNPLCGILEGFLNELMGEDLSEDQERHCYHLIEMTTDVERVSDLADDLAQIAQGKTKPNALLDPQMIKEIDKLFHQAHRTYTLALHSVRDNDRDVAQLACSMEDEMDRKYWKARKKHDKRVKSGEVSPETDQIYNDILRNLDRISDHADSLGISVMRD
jgi:phosphate:Na+ symporter